jgi:8-oxo-dGTP pyrophosphatase MutT (NUDIX family)
VIDSTRAELVAAQVAEIEPVDERERDSITALLARLGEGDDPFSEFVSPRHVTASAFVISARGIVLLRHKRLGIWVQPGGHVDGDEAPLVAAIREVREETGLLTTPLAGGAVVHVDVHDGPRGHLHYDLRYLLRAPADDPVPDDGESPDVAWFSFDEAMERAEDALRPAIAALSRRGADAT